ncbi:MAG: hypothetical protein AUH81_09340 [Candidatus Rokubacteria bacterium 13_1_40CM_4_69_5]|nr:MAG: hypothetical protein AUH81_09340 [Candidatus Rokubacteria bacterium 13_1_40CM_4_69_5]
MSDSPDREFLLSVFLMEAWDTLAAVEEGAAALASEADANAEPLRIVTHRLRGAAALNGFPQVSALAAAMEASVDRASVAPLAERPRAVARLVELVGCLKQALDGIGATGREDAAAIGAVLGTQAAASPSPPAPAPGASGLLAALDRFFRENGDVLEYFIPEATEHLELMAQSLLALEREGRSDAELATLFRAVHTLKGAAYTVGCTIIATLAHRIEDLLGEIRENQRPLTPAALEAVYAGLDALRLLIRSAEGAPAGREEAFGRAASLLDALAPAAEATPPPALATLSAGETAPSEPVTMASPVALKPEAAAVPAGAGRASTPPAPSAPRTAPGRPLRPSIRVNLDRLDALMNLVGELVIARSRLERHLAQLDRVGELLVFTQTRMTQAFREFETKYVNPGLPGAGGAGDGARRRGPDAIAGPLPVPTPAPSPADAFAELEFDRYDDFNILARRAAEIAGDIAEVQLQLAALVRVVRADAARMQQLSGELRSEITRARMVPIGRLFARFSRQAREAARAAGKTIELEVSGEAVEMDNTVIEQITDPLLHLLQNAIAHGIEAEDQRRERGKAPHGTIRLSAVPKGGAIYIEVADDGLGIDIELVKARAIEDGFVKPEALALMNEHDVLDLIFLPGFSTAPTVTTAAGRGVGMDVVRTNVGRLGGEIDVQTEVGAGTRFTLKLPLTVAISDALLARIGTETLAIPVPAVKAMVRVRPDEIQGASGAETVEVEGQRLDLVRLDRILGLTSRPPGGPLPVVALRTGRKTLAVVVDELLGKEEIVIKRLGAFLEGVGYFSGATVSGDGRVILLLDPVRLLEAGGGAEAMRSAAAIVDSPPAAASRAPQAARAVLLVDDSVSVRKFVGQMLERAGFRVVTANDGAEALQQLGDDPVVNVVVTDLEMPRLNGYELIRDLKRRPATRDLPIVVLTTRAGQKHVDLARQLGVQHYVTKPVDEQAFVQLIDTLTATEAAGVAV